MLLLLLMWCHFGMTVPVRTAEDMRACEERLRQLVEKLKSEGINMTQWRLGTFQRMLCPEVECVAFCEFQALLLIPFTFYFHACL
jgi:hypothetical protein